MSGRLPKSSTMGIQRPQKTIMQMVQPLDELSSFLGHCATCPSFSDGRFWQRHLQTTQENNKQTSEGLIMTSNRFFLARPAFTKTLLSTVIALAATPAMAQEGDTLEEVVVTAQFHRNLDNALDV